MQIYSLNGALTCPGKGRVASLVDRTYKKHIDDILGDGGVIPNQSLTREWVQFRMRRNPAEIALDIHPDATGYKIGAAAGQLSKLYSINREGDLLQTVGGSQPIVHEWRGENYWNSPGVASNYVSTPNATANQITGDIDIDCQIFSSLSTSFVFVGKDGSGRAYLFRFNAPTSKLGFVWFPDGSTFTETLSSINFTAGNQPIYVRATRVASTGVVKFFTSTDGVTWVQFGADVAGAIGNLTQSSNTLQIGANNGAVTGTGRVYKARIYNGIRENGGTLAVNFNANDYRKADPTNQTSWVASQTGETWTINTDANATGIKGVLVDHTAIQTDGVSHFMQGAFSLNQPVSSYVTVKTFNALSNVRLFSFGNMLARFGSGNNLYINAGVNVGWGTYVYDKSKQSAIVCAIFNKENSSYSVNGVSKGVGNVGTNSGLGFSVGSGWNGLEPINALYSTIIATRTADTPGQQSAMNSFINQLHKRLY